MKLAFFATLLLTLNGCDQRAPPLAAYRHPIDALASIFPLEWFGVYQCASRHNASGTDVIQSVPLDQCYKMNPAQRYRGIWLDQFEGSLFFAGASDAARAKAQIRHALSGPNLDVVWLGRNELYKAVGPPVSNSRLIAVDFIGRQTAYKGRYGHMGAARSAIIVDRVLSARPIYQASTQYLEDEPAPR